MAANPERPSAEQRDGRQRVLVVDDEQVILDLLELVLGFHGYDVVCCSSGLEALERCRVESFEVLICDYGLGDLDGISLHRTLSQEGHSLAARTILVTGEVVDPSVDAFLEETGLCALRKPFDMDELSARIGEIIQRPGVPGPR